MILYIKKDCMPFITLSMLVIEGIFKVSHSWNPTISITGIISLLVAIPLISIIRLLSLYWVGIDIPMKVSTIVGIIIYGCF